MKGKEIGDPFQLADRPLKKAYFAHVKKKKRKGGFEPLI